MLTEVTLSPSQFNAPAPTHVERSRSEVADHPLVASPGSRPRHERPTTSSRIGDWRPPTDCEVMPRGYLARYSGGRSARPRSADPPSEREGNETNRVSGDGPRHPRANRPGRPRATSPTSSRVV